MSRCPYTWFRGLFGPVDPKATEASYLRVRVLKEAVQKVDVTLPAHSARWLVDLIPDDVVAKIREEKIPLDAIQAELAAAVKLVPRRIFELVEPERTVQVWLE